MFLFCLVRSRGLWGPPKAVPMMVEERDGKVSCFCFVLFSLANSLVGPPKAVPMMGEKWDRKL